MDHIVGGKFKLGRKIGSGSFGELYLAPGTHDQFQIPNTEELNQMKEQNAKLQELLEEQKKANSQLEGGTLSLTMEEILSNDEKLRNQVKEMEERLTKLREGVTLVSPEERKAVEKNFSDAISHWRKRKRMFKDVWDAITENSPKNPHEFKEELGVEYDEDIGVSLQTYTTLVPHGKKRLRG